MNVETTSDAVGISATAKPLSNEELLNKSKLQTRCTKGKQKRNISVGTQVEASELQTLQTALSQAANAPSIKHLGALAKAVWDEEAQAVQVLEKQYKMNHAGYRRNGKLYLEYFESMYLLETGHLHIDYNAKTLSVEQAYSLLLGEKTSPKYTNYLVYSQLTNVGYVIVKYQNRAYAVKPVTADDCVWAVLFNELYGKPISDNMLKFKEFKQIKHNMKQHKLYFTARKLAKSAEDLTINGNTNISSTIEHTASKREAFEDLPGCNWHFTTRSTTRNISKISNSFNKNQPESAVSSNQDELTENIELDSKIDNADDSEVDYFPTTSTRTAQNLFNKRYWRQPYNNIQNIFERFDVIQLKNHISNEVNCRKFNISFDLYLPNDGFRRHNPIAPTFRIVVLNADEPFPTDDEIVLCYRQQIYPVELLLVFVTPSNRLNIHLCEFS